MITPATCRDPLGEAKAWREPGVEPDREDGRAAPRLSLAELVDAQPGNSCIAGVGPGSGCGALCPPGAGESARPETRHPPAPTGSLSGLAD